MLRSSPSIATLAAALARAQAEIENPEKRVTAIIRSPCQSDCVDLAVDLRKGRAAEQCLRY